MAAPLMDFEYEMATAETATTTVKNKWQQRQLAEEISSGGSNRKLQT
ncbi:hypothetical protein OROGR_027256 [Orobanche gracilis]